MPNATQKMTINHNTGKHSHITIVAPPGTLFTKTTEVASAKDAANSLSWDHKKAKLSADMKRLKVRLIGKGHPSFAAAGAVVGSAGVVGLPDFGLLSITLTDTAPGTPPAPPVVDDIAVEYVDDATPC